MRLLKIVGFFQLSIILTFFILILLSLKNRLIFSLIKDKFKAAIKEENYYDNPNLRDVIDFIQTNFQCCGYRNFLAWKGTSDDGFFPASCCEKRYSLTRDTCLNAQKSAFGRGNLTKVFNKPNKC